MSAGRQPGPPELVGVEHRYVDIGGLRVHVAEAGAGEPVVLQHGWPQHWWVWRDVVGLLAPHYRVICPDLRGHGWTGAPPGAYDKPQLATDLLGVLDALQLDRVRLVGHDWGAFAGFLACLRAPERFSHYLALSILHPWPPREKTDPRRIARAWYQMLIASPGAGQLLVQRAGFVPRILAKGRVAGRYSKADLAIHGDRFKEPARAAATVALYRTFLTKELKPLLTGAFRDERLTVPTRMLVGSEDAVFKGNPLAGFAEHADDMTLEWIAGAGHFLPEECPDVVTDRALALFAS